jgi:hypothetical protein
LVLLGMTEDADYKEELGLKDLKVFKVFKV